MKERRTLSPIELDVLEAIAQGYDNHQIATALCRSLETIRTHVVNLRLKLAARNRTHAVAIAYHVGLFAGRAAEHTSHITHVRYPLNRKPAPARGDATRPAPSSPAPASADSPTTRTAATSTRKDTPPSTRPAPR